MYFMSLQQCSQFGSVVSLGPGTMRRFFICYGSKIDQEQANLLRDHFRKSLRASVEDFWVEPSPDLSGEELAADVRRGLLDCDALLAVIGPDWRSANAQADGTSGLDDLHDKMHCAIVTALSVGVPAIPVLVNGASMPPSLSIPANIRSLGRRKASVLRKKAFKADASRLFKRLTPRRLGRAAPSGYGSRNKSNRPWASHLVAAPVLGLMAFGTTDMVPKLSNPTIDSGPVAKSNAHRPLPPKRSIPALASTRISASPNISPRRRAMDDAYTVAPGETRTLNPATNEPAGVAPLLVTAINGQPVESGDLVSLQNGGQLKMIGAAIAFTAGPTTGEEAFEYSVMGDDGELEQSRVVLRVAEVQPKRRQDVVKTFRDCGDCPDMVVVPPGSFLMGSPADELGRYDDEGPQRRVAVKAFAIGIYEVTWSQYRACVDAGACAPLTDDGFGGGRTPVTNLNWYEAKAYVEWLSRSTSKNYRLLSEAEWEYAARAGTRTPFSFGKTISDSQANFDATTAYGDGQPGRKRGATLPVGAFSPNAFGLFDMHGNVLEWTEDCYTEDYASGQPSNGDPFSSASCPNRIARGGSWANDASLLRSALRAGDPATARMRNLGVRVARDL